MTGKTLTEEQKIGAAIAIVFVMIYSVIDDFLKKMKGSAGAVAESATVLTVATQYSSEQVQQLYVYRVGC